MSLMSSTNSWRRFSRECEVSGWVQVTKPIYAGGMGT